MTETHKDVQCGNKRHPDGAWHPAAYYPIRLFDRFVQWWRRRQWGCGCPRTTPRRRKP
jgi:hypothetical protein